MRIYLPVEVNGFTGLIGKYVLRQGRPETPAKWKYVLRQGMNVDRELLDTRPS